MKDLRFSICIPVRNDPGNLKRCLAGFRNQDLSDCEILVCDDGSTPALSTADLNEAGVEFRLIHQAGQGPSVARNQLARIARGTFLFFVDADTIPHSQMLERARNIIAEQPQIGAFYGSYDDEPDHRTLVSSYKNLLHHYTHQQSASGEEEVTTFWCGCGVIRRELYLQYGGLSEFYDTPSIEDIELGVRLNANGIRIRIFPQLQVKHLKKWTLMNWVHTDLFRRGIPWVRLMRATSDWTSQLNFSWSQRAASFAAAMLVACIPFMANPAFVFTGILAFAVFLVLNRRFINLVRRKRGLLVSVAVVPLHILYALICVTSAVAAVLCPPLRLPESLPLLADDSAKVTSEICSKE